MIIEVLYYIAVIVINGAGQATLGRYMYIMIFISKPFDVVMLVVGTVEGESNMTHTFFFNSNITVNFTYNNTFYNVNQVVTRLSQPHHIGVTTL